MPEPKSQVWKFPFSLKEDVVLSMPAGAKILKFAWSLRTGFALWALVDVAAPTEERRFRLVGTGSDLGENVLPERYVGTVLANDSVWHLFEVPGVAGSSSFSVEKLDDEDEGSVEVSPIIDA